MSRFRYNPNGSKRYDMLTPEEKAAQLDHVLRKVRMGLDYLLAQVRDSRELYSNAHPAQADASFTFQMAGVETVYVSIMSPGCIGNEFTVTVDVQQLMMEAGHTKRHASLLHRYTDQFKKLFESYNPTQYHISDCNMQSYLVFAI